MVSPLPDPARLVEALGLAPHPEGGFYRETYRARSCDASGRAASTLIYFLLLPGQVSRLHRIDADEGWHLYVGGPLLIHELDESAHLPATMAVLGTDLGTGQRPQHVVPAGRWFGATLGEGARYALVGCSVAPGFEFSRFELGDRDRLIERFPAQRELIERLT